jgi:hypothetical protein
VTVDELAAALAAEWLAPAAERPLTDAFASEGRFSTTGLSTSAAADAVVVITSWDDTPDPVALAIARKLHDAGIPAVGVEAVSMPTGLADAALDLGLSAIDDMGRPEATYSLVAVLSGKASGAFGIGETAARLYPRIEPDQWRSVANGEAQ